MSTFADLKLTAPILKAIAEMGYEEPSPVQAQTIPLLLAGGDLIVQSLTGTGKTAAFGIPMLERSVPRSKRPSALVLAPTRELAVQVSGELSRIGRFREISVVPIYGGQSMNHQLRSLAMGAQVVVATPGRLLDHVRRRSLDLSQVNFVVLDEADEMLNMGFMEDVELILKELPAQRQTALFSATMPDAIVRLAKTHLKNPQRVSLPSPKGLSLPNIAQHYYEVPRHHKLEVLARLIDIKKPELALVFCSTKHMTDTLADELISHGYRAEPMHGGMSQNARDKVMKRAREGRLEILVATDVAARGIDIEGITHVINYDLPRDPESYIHRIGRTGRAGRAGQAFSLVSPSELREVKLIERATKAHIERAEIPTAIEIEERQREKLKDRLLTSLREGSWGQFRDLIAELAEEHPPIDLAAAALAMTVRPARPRKEIQRVEPEAHPKRSHYGQGRPPRHDTRSGKNRPRQSGARRSHRH